MMVLSHSILALQVLCFLILMLLEYLSGYRAGVMQHLYVQKISLYNSLYHGLLPIHLVVISSCFVFYLFKVPFKSKRNLICDFIFMIIYAICWGFFILKIIAFGHWPPDSHLIIFFELAVISQLVRLFVKIEY